MNRTQTSSVFASLRRATACSLWMAAGLLATAAHAAGGHHAIDDAALLDEGQCSLEAWGERQHGGGRTLAHVGPSCRVGAVELGLNIDREKFSGQPHTTLVSPQLKWAVGLTEAVSVGLVGSVGYITSPSTQRTGSTLVVPLTWRATPTLTAHANWGRDFVRSQPNKPRGGVALEWAPIAEGSLVVERFLQSDVHSARLGARWAVAPGLSLDVSRARAFGSGQASTVTVGVNWEFERPGQTAAAR